MSKYLIKLSGEALAGEKGYGIDPKVVNQFAEDLKSILKAKPDVKLGIVVGGGNMWRGESAADLGMNRTRADYIGMMATMMNGLALQDALESVGIKTRVQTALEMSRVAEPYIQRRALRHLEKGRVLIFVGGTGSPYFSTDTTTILRASELDFDYVLMGKNGVDGIYNKDPKIDPKAKKYYEITYHEILNQNLRVMDLTATSLASDNNIKLIVFNINQPGNILKVINNEKIGTLVTNGKA